MIKKPAFIWKGGAVIFFTVILLALSHLFHQEAPQNTIRILIPSPMDAKHFRLQPLIAEKHYLYEKKGDDFDLIPPDMHHPVLHFQLVRDENTRALIFLKGDADVLYNSLSLAKTEWLRKKAAETTVILEASGTSTSYLALNQERVGNPLLIEAITAALPLKLWIDTLFLKWVESTPAQLKFFDPEKAKSKVNQLPDSLKHLDYLTMGTREGLQLAQLTREALEKIGITVEIHSYESALFYAKIKKREFDLFSSRPVPGSKSILDLPGTTLIPLFTWKHGLILNSRVNPRSLMNITLDETFRFLSELQLQ